MIIGNDLWRNNFNFLINIYIISTIDAMKRVGPLINMHTCSTYRHAYNHNLAPNRMINL